ncbi:Hypothetical protein LUCI_3160 [Lucifera butyrica]|uniref:Uncharacterized protein n=1 Tax=Lucifera butyrica TaxID=1351585 RepID=A0A498RA89_9FIRM|nr:hypothetical protein [Lucifera butyrica]VBB07895.1 Hypothetical protein LUCI_3160 [Lucifera butyrica]
MENIKLYWISLIIPAVVFAPNLLWLLFPLINMPAAEERKEPITLTILEDMGRVGVIIIPLFYPIGVDAAGQSCLVAMIVLLLIYYARWFPFPPPPIPGKSGLFFLPLNRNLSFRRSRFISS